MASRSATISKPDLVALAVSELGGAHDAIDTEDIAVRAHELSPVAFAWRRYPEHINLELVRVALVGATRNGLVAGRGRGGWVLTDAGERWAKSNREQLLATLGGASGAERPVRRTEDLHTERERVRVGRTEAHQKWSGGLAVTAAEARAVFRVDQYTTETTRLTKIRSLRDLFHDDPDLGPFIQAMSAIASTAPNTGDQDEH
jgi:hypothetical protein